ncbi:uncharacterized protein LOC118205636 [Stegodyphus dumicola]|uniref:uncharacterized protein LOC118205636 n=1 Tax=Stegodyphus dumicola TaxID=202533 RepID=UPI0015AA2244|nr:uncharacterized protein LOC118205636 [Stegodyphus dumicola]
MENNGRLNDYFKCRRNGPSKTADRWRKTWRDYKFSIKKKAAKIAQHKRETGGGPEIKDNLTPLEERVLAPYGSVMSRGNDEVPESAVEFECFENVSPENISEGNIPLCDVDFNTSYEVIASASNDSKGKTKAYGSTDS